MAIVVHAPPPRCARCGRVASTDASETTCVECGAPLPARGEPLVVPISGDIALGETLPALRSVEVPISGTALLSIERITQLRVTMDAATITADRSGGTLRLVITPHATQDGLSLPASVGVNVGVTDDDFNRLHAVYTKLVEDVPVAFDFPFDAAPSKVVVTLSYADALCRRHVDIR